MSDRRDGARKGGGRKDGKGAPSRPAAQNRKATFDYEIEEKYEAGMVLTGGEVKSLRMGGASLVDAYAMVKRGELWLVGMHIRPYHNAGYAQDDPWRERKLLVHKRELARLAGATAQKGITLVPLKVYFNERGFAKVTLGLGHGKRDWDRRQDIRKRETQRELSREYKLR